MMTSAVSSPAPSSSSTLQTRSTRKRRQKTFTGCWTCRSRHVKCDEQRPECRRCLAGSFECQGYGTRLTWVSPPDKALKTGNSRAGQQPASRPSPPESQPASASREEDGSSRAQGPRSSCRRTPTTKWKAFTVFPASVPDGQDAQPPTNNPRRNTRSRIAVAGSRVPSGMNTHDLPILPTPDFAISHPSSDSASPTASLNNSNWPSETLDNLLWEDGYIANMDDGGHWGWNDMTIPEDRAADALNFASFSNAESFFDSTATDYQRSHVDHTQDYQHRRGTISPSMGNPRMQLDMLPASARHRELINHWATNLCHKLLPIRSPMNPFLVIVSPMALEGSRIGHDQSSSAVALFHAVCAVSAVHQQNLKGVTTDEERALTLHHKRLSFYHLMKNLHRTDLDARMASLSTLCLWLMSHFISGEPGSWREVVKVTRDLLKETANDTWTRSAAAAATYQSFSSFFALVLTQYLGRGESPAPMKVDLAGSDVHKAMAIPDQSLDLISSFNSGLIQGHVVTAEKLDQMEIEFALSAPSPADHLHAASHDQLMAQHHSSLFYYASLLYFRCVSGRRGPESEIQDIVSRCLEHMESLDAMNLHGSPRLWVYAAVAFEAGTPQLRSRIRTTFQNRASLAFKSWDTVLLAAEQIWTQRDSTPPGWELEPWPQLLSRMPEHDVIFY